MVLATVAICDCKKRRPRRKRFAEYEFPVPFPSEELFDKRRSTWSNNDAGRVARWLAACGNALGTTLLPAPIVAWADAMQAAEAVGPLAAGPEPGAALINGALAADV